MKRLRRLLCHVGVAATFLVIGLIFIPAGRFLLWVDPTGAELRWAVDHTLGTDWPSPPLYFGIGLLVLLGAALGWCWHDIAPWIYHAVVRS